EAGHRGDFSLSFQPENQLEHYLLVLEHSEKGFSQLEYSRLYRAAEEKRLFLKAPEKQALVYGKANQLELQLCDQAGQPQPNVHLSLQVLSSDMRPEVDTFGSIYGDYQGSGLSLDTPRPTQSSYAASETLAYEVVETDENGRASLHFTMPSEKQKDCYLIAQAILCEGTEVSAGSLLLELQLPEILPAQEEEILPQTKTYGYSIKTLQAGMRLDADSRLVICGDAERLQLLDLLLAPAFDSSEQKGIEMLFSQAYAQQLLVDYGGDHMALLFDPQPFSVVNYQKADGGLGEESASSDPVLSAKLAAMTPSGISYYALSHYFEELLDQGPSLNEQAVALAGMASCGRANIREVKALLQNKELDDSAYCWLLWALIRNGDRATAAQLYESRIFTEMQEGDSLAWRAVLAAALGHGKEALLLLEEAEALEDELMAEQLLIARSLLPRSRQPERSFSYSVGEEIYEATVSGINDYFLSPLALNGEIRFTKAEEGLAFCNIFWHDPSAAEKP
ncbi:MAG: hypothetical protein Q4B50_07175, partial [Bacillota bacterium]|nr:hypothetical protein [Bacillota bacterium]